MMGGYGTPIGETKSYVIYLSVNCSDEFDKFRFKIERKSDNLDIDYCEGCSAEECPDLKKFNEELQTDYVVYYIKDKGLRDKAEFEYRYKELEKENIKLKEGMVAYREQISNIKKLL